MKKLAIIVAVLLSGSAYACNEVVLELVALEEEDKQDTCVYQSIATGEKWWYFKKDLIDQASDECPFVIKSNEL